MCTQGNTKPRFANSKMSRSSELLHFTIRDRKEEHRLVSRVFDETKRRRWKLTFTSGPTTQLMDDGSDSTPCSLDIVDERETPVIRFTVDGNGPEQGFYTLLSRAATALRI